MSAIIPAPGSRIPTGLRIFIIVSVALHLTAAAATIIPHVIRQRREARRLALEKLARDEARRRAEEAARQAARELARAKTEEVLKKDAEDLLLGSMEEQDFERLWQALLAALDKDLAAFLDRLEGLGYNLDPAQLQDMMVQLRAVELQKIMEVYARLAKEDMAAQVLERLRASLPKLNEQVAALLARDGKRIAEQLAQALKKQGAEKAALDELQRLLADGSLKKCLDQHLARKLKETLADDLARQAQQLAGGFLERKGFGADEDFAKELAKSTYMLLTGADTAPLREQAFDRLAPKDVGIWGVINPKLIGEPPAEGGPPPKEGAGWILEAPGDGGGGGFMDSPKLGFLTQSMIRESEASIDAALLAGRKLFNLPSVTGLGTKSDLLFRIETAVGGGGGATPSGALDMSIINLNRDLGYLGRATVSGVGQAHLFGGLGLSEERYRQNLAAIQQRTLEEAPLQARSTPDASAAAMRFLDQRMATMLVDAPEPSREPEAAAVKTLYRPNFKTFAYGGAVLATNPPVIDGDLSDWSGVEDFKLRGVVMQGGWPGPLPPEWENNRFLMVQWNPGGFYFGYRMVDARDNVLCNHELFWQNDAIELFFDFSNKRPETRTALTQQFWFWPLGSALLSQTIGGQAMDYYGPFVPRFRAAAPAGQPQLAVKRTLEPRGYQVELFMPARTFSNFYVAPGKIIAFNFSLNNGESCYLRWTENLGRNISAAPSLWGDLVLLGTDAEISFIKPGTNAVVKAIIPGEPLGIRVRDPDMNLQPAQREKIAVAIAARSGDAIQGYLQETGPRTGVFEGSVDTELRPPGADRLEKPRAALLRIVGGDEITVTYEDQARRYGERNYEARAFLPVGLPVLSLGAQGGRK